MTGTVLLIGLHIAVFHPQVAASDAEHMPHSSNFLTAFQVECPVPEGSRRMVNGRHAAIITLLESGVKLFEKGLVHIHFIERVGNVFYF